MAYTEIKTFEDACKALGYSTQLPDYSFAPEKHRQAMIDHYKLVIIVEAINEGWEPNWSDTNERKYELWPDIVEDSSKAAGFGLSSYDFDYWLTFTNCGSRLCFPGWKKAKYCFETFQDLWESYFLISK